MSEFLSWLYRLVLRLFDRGQGPQLAPTPDPPDEPDVVLPVESMSDQEQEIGPEVGITLVDPEQASEAPVYRRKPHMPKFTIRDDYMIPVETGQAVSRGWTAYADHQPKGVTWHWTATWDLRACRKTLGGSDAWRKGEASAHYGVGRSYEEGVDRYVSLENRSWHAGAGQSLRWDGKPANHQGNWWSGARTTIGIETVNIGYAREGVEAGDDWIPCVSPNGKQEMLVQPWPSEQVHMMICVGKEVLARWPHIRPRDHHGHHDLCYGHKTDVCGFPFAQVLRGIYDDLTIPDVWTPLWGTAQRQRALYALGYDLGSTGVDGAWGRASDAALRKFQRDVGITVDGQWTTFVHWAIYDALQARGIDLATVTRG